MTETYIDDFQPMHIEGSRVEQSVEGGWVVSSIPFVGNWDGTFSEASAFTSFGPFEICVPIDNCEEASND